MSKFKVWIDSPVTGTNIQSYGTFDSDSQRSNGFVAGTSSSAIRVNTGLRQANLVVAALMDLVNDNNLSVESSVSDVSSSLNNYFTGLSVNNVTTKINNKNIIDIFESNGTTVKNATNATAATNVTTNINSKAITSIFESNGTTVKKSTEAEYASSDHTKGTIDTRIDTNKTNITNITNGTTPVSVKKYDGTMVQLTQTVDDTLKLGNSVIPQYKLIWSGSVTPTDQNFGTSLEIDLNDIDSSYIFCYGNSKISKGLKARYEMGYYFLEKTENIGVCRSRFYLGDYLYNSINHILKVSYINICVVDFANGEIYDEYDKHGSHYLTPLTAIYKIIE